jgi:hypothetical protein
MILGFNTNFMYSARAVGRGGAATANVKRFDISPVYHKSVAGGHPKESLEATFDIVQDEGNIRGHQLEAETLLSVCQVMSSLPSGEGTSDSEALSSKSSTKQGAKDKKRRIHLVTLTI